MRSQRKTVSTIIALALTMTASPALAGGLEANGYNWDLLFDPATYASKASVTYVDIEQNVRNPGSGVPGVVASSADRVHYNFGIKADLTDAASCLVSVQNPWGSAVDRDPTYAAPRFLPVSERVTSFDAGLTCSYGIDLGAGVLSVIGGVSAQTLNYDAEFVVGPGTMAPLSLNGSSAGWRAGVAYEIEEIALRVSAIYNSEVAYDLSGTSPFGPATSSATMPQSFEVKGQTGIAPDWLALASVKWVDWSVLQALTVTTAAPLPMTTNLNYRDGWTVTGGVGHAVTPDLTVLGMLTWDRGTSSTNGAGVLVSGTQTDRWGATLGAAYDVTQNIEFSGGISYSILEGGSNLAGETWDGGSVLGIGAGLKASF